MKSIETRLSLLDKLKVNKQLVKFLVKSKVIEPADTSEWTMWHLWVMICHHSVVLPNKLELLSFSGGNYAVKITDLTTGHLVYQHSRTIKTAFNQAVVAYVKLCTQSK